VAQLPDPDPADLRLLLDRFAIDDLLTAYTMAVDGRDWDALDEVFTPDALIDYTATGGIAGAYPEVKRWLAETLPVFSAMQHVVAQKAVEIDGDTARVRAYFLNPLVIDRPVGGPWRMDLGGAYVHTLVRTGVGWRSRQLVEEVLWERRDP
jgi:hypothetical protein